MTDSKPKLRSGEVRATVSGQRPAGATSAHAASKPGYRHKLSPTRRLRRDFAYSQLHAEGKLGLLASGQRCVPPHIKIRPPLEPARPLNAAERAANYWCTPRTVPSPPAQRHLTPAQRRRIRHKLNHSMRKVRGGAPPERVKPALSKTPKGTRQPRSGELSRGFRRLLGRLSPANRARAMAKR
jgi:hypothetical protein